MCTGTESSLEGEILDLSGILQGGYGDRLSGQHLAVDGDIGLSIALKSVLS